MSHFLFSLQGRARRLHYWLFGLAMIVVHFIAMVILAPSMFSENASGTPPLVFTVMSLVLLYPAMAVTVRRTNDINWSPLWAYGITAASAAFTVGDAFGLFESTQAVPALVALAVVGLIAVVLAIVIGCIRSVDGVNAHGPSPLAVTA